MNKVYITDINNLKKWFSYEELYNKASSYRKQKVDKLKFEKDKFLSLGVDYLFRCALKDIGIEYSNAEIDFKSNNKPIIKNYDGIFFNLSHSEEIAMCVISNNEVGCDVQKMSADFLDIADRFFCQSEIDLITCKETFEEKRDMFYRLWTLKESYMKALGLGFKLGLSEFQIYYENNTAKVWSNKNLDTNFYFEEIKLENQNYKCSICSKSFAKCEVKEILNNFLNDDKRAI